MTNSIAQARRTPSFKILNLETLIKTSPCTWLWVREVPCSAECRLLVEETQICVICPHTTCPLCQGDTGLLCQTQTQLQTIILRIDENHEREIPKNKKKKRDHVCKSGDPEACFILLLTLFVSDNPQMKRHLNLK